MGSVFRHFSLTVLFVWAGFANAQQHDSANWFPANTRVFLSVSNLEEAKTQLENTGIGKAWSNESMKPFQAGLESTEVRLTSLLQENFGLDQKQLLDTAKNELSIGLIEIADGTLSVSVIIELDEAQAEQMTTNAKTLFTKVGANQTTDAEIPDATVFNLTDGQQVVYLYKNGYLLASGDVGAAKQIASLWTASRNENSLATTEAFTKTTAKLTEDDSANIRWFVDVIHYAIAADQDKEEPTDPSFVPFPLRHGFDGIRGIGGATWLRKDGFDFLNKIKVYMPDPQQALQMLDFVPGKATAPEIIPIQSTFQITMRWNLHSLFSHIGPVYDDITDSTGKGGAWKGTLDDLKQNLKVDLMGFLSMLDPEMAMATDLDVEQRRERTVTSIKLKNPADEREVAKALILFWRKDNKATRTKVPGYPNYLWQIRFKGDASFSRAGMMVADGRLWISTHASMIRDVLLGKAKAKPLTSDPVYQEAIKRMSPFAGNGTFARSFVRMDKDILNTYEVLRTDGLDALENVESVYSRAVLAIVAKNKTLDSAKLDFSKLPPFSTIAPFLGVTSGIGNKDDDGFSIVVGVYSKD